MSSMKHAAFLIVSFGFVVTICLVYAFRHLAFRFHLLDIPNARSSHVSPTPSAGGIGIALSFFIGLALLHCVDLCRVEILISFFIGGLILASIGFIDDFKHLPIRVRIVFHFIVASLVIYSFGSLPILDCGFFIWHWHYIGLVVALLGLVWLINLYNFMDGIDGLAASEAVFVSSSVALLLFMKGSFTLIPLFALLASACAGFLVWNWSPARVFMGDTGSGFLGFVFGVLLIVTTNMGFLTPWQWLILLGCFWVDATLTLLFRVVMGQPWYLAHRSHAFQQAVKKTGCHRQVVMRIQMINILWLLPMAMLTVYFPQWIILITFVAILPIILLCILLKAGITTQNDEPISYPIAAEQSS